jgi:ribosomal protein S18 acetylase RimI-like enzyme
MGDLRLSVLTNADPRFYPTLGPYLARRDIVQALGGPLYDDPGKLWFVLEDDGRLAGFGGLTLEGDEAHFCSDYVLPEWRRKGLHNRLVAERLAHLDGTAKRATVTPTIAGSFAYRKHGFVEARTAKRPMKNFLRMERAL